MSSQLEQVVRDFTEGARKFGASMQPIVKALNEALRKANRRTVPPTKGED